MNKKILFIIMNKSINSENMICRKLPLTTTALYQGLTNAK